MQRENIFIRNFVEPERAGITHKQEPDKQSER